MIQFQDVHETAAGALWNLAFNPGNALRIVEDGGVPALVHICTKSLSKMARFMAALALAYIFDGRYRFRMLVICYDHTLKKHTCISELTWAEDYHKPPSCLLGIHLWVKYNSILWKILRMHVFSICRMDEIAAVGPSSDGDIKSVTLNVVKRISLKHIEAFVCSFSDSKTSDTVIKLSAPTALTQVAEAACIPEAGLLRCRFLFVVFLFLFNFEVSYVVISTTAMNMHIHNMQQSNSWTGH